jgi:hypothetical protein
MNQAFNPITRRVIPVNYYSPGLLFLVSSGSGSSLLATLDLRPTEKSAGPVISVTELGASLRIDWNLVADAPVYLLYRSTSPSGPFEIYVSGVADNHYVDTPTVPGTYYYQVTAIEPNAGESLPSNVASGTTV